MSVKRNKPYGYTPHEVAVAYMREGWNGAGSREGWYAKLRADAQKKSTKTDERPRSV